MSDACVLMCAARWAPHMSAAHIAHLLHIFFLFLRASTQKWRVLIYMIAHVWRSSRHTWAMPITQALQTWCELTQNLFCVRTCSVLVHIMSWGAPDMMWTNTEQVLCYWSSSHYTWAMAITQALQTWCEQNKFCVIDTTAYWHYVSCHDVNQFITLCSWVMTHQCHELVHIMSGAHMCSSRTHMWRSRTHMSDGS